MVRNWDEIGTAHEKYGRVLGGSESRRALGDCVKDRLRVRRRGGDDAQDVRDRSLLLERLLRLVEEPSVLDRDPRLIGERLEQAKLLRRERLNAETAGPDRADDLIAAEDRHGCDRVDTVLDVRWPAIVRINEQVRDVDERAIERDTSDKRFSRDLRRMLTLVRDQVGRTASRRDDAEHVAVAAE